MSTPETGTGFYTNGNGEKGSTILGVSIRGWIAIMLTASVCVNQLTVTAAALIHAVQTKDLTHLGTFATIGEPLYSMGVAALGFYFGQKSTKP